MASVNRVEQSAPAAHERRSEDATILNFPDRDRSAGVLARLLDREIIPRLLLAHGAGTPETAPPGPPPEGLISAFEISTFALASVTEEIATLMARLDGVRARGHGDQALCLDLLAPAAKLLGILWEEDRATFADVTVGLARMQQIVQELSARSAPDDTDPDRTALLAAVPGEQHTFGVVLVADAFRRADWRVKVATEARAEDLADIAAEESFDLIGLSAVHDCGVGELRLLVRTLRRASLNRSTQIFVGGRFVDERPGLLAEVGADGGAEDARRAVEAANERVRARAHQS